MFFPLLSERTHDPWMELSLFNTEMCFIISALGGCEVVLRMSMFAVVFE